MRVGDTSRVSETFGGRRLGLLPAVAAWKQRCGLGGLGPGSLGAGACRAGSAADLTFPSLVLTVRPRFVPSTRQGVQSAPWTWAAGSCGEEGRPWGGMVVQCSGARTVLLLAGLPESAGK